MIYAQMRSVPRWRTPVTPVLFLLFALAGGALLAGAPGPAAWLLGGLGLAQIAAWLHGDRRLAGSGTTLAAATGLGALGRLRLLAPPHTGRNYLLREMVHVVGRRHALKLRIVGLALAVALPLALIAFAPSAPLPLALAALAHVVGALVLRWLFFAESEHVVGLYYGRR
jgi:DMSO reductase anchor subunit